MAKKDTAVDSSSEEAKESPKQETAESEPDMLNDHEAAHHLDTLMQAEKIKADPKKMAKVHALAGFHSKSIKSIQDLKDLHQAKYGAGKKAEKIAVDKPHRSVKAMEKKLAK